MFASHSFLVTMFSSLGMFKKVQCPEQSHCSLSKCIFSHQVPLGSKSAEDQNSQSEPGDRILFLDSRLISPTSGDLGGENHEQDQPRKRRRLSKCNDDNVFLQTSGSEGPRSQPLIGQIETESTKLPSTAAKEITPPPPRVVRTKAVEDLLAKAEAAIKAKSIVNSTLQGAFTPAQEASTVSLNPRLIHNPPVSHAVRIQLVTMLHDQIVRLNDGVSQSPDASTTMLKLSSSDMVLTALEEEENIAKQNPAVYLNVIKLRITKLKKMKLEEWKEERLKQLAKKNPVQSSADTKIVPKVIETGLTPSQEIAFLSKMLAKQHQLTKYGYVSRAPSEVETAASSEGVKAAQGWEQCDRCKSRFQVFPGRREEDGALTSGGTCSYHPAKPRRPLAKDKADKSIRDSTYACCNESVGTSAGCTQAPTHVFKVSDPKRLSLIMPFKETPPKLQTPGPIMAVCFDCEMGYTTMGLELIRLTATSWPTGGGLLDVLVRPLGEILDLNSQFSGVWPTDYANAQPYNSGTADSKSDPKKDSASQLRLVESPLIARDLLFDLLTPETPLIGHALDNDLNSTRIIHPSIVDSVLLYPHPRGLPIRFGLKMLIKKYLDRDIQMGGTNGHDSKEDARAAGDLVRLKVGETWKAMQRDGWTVTKTDFLPPLPSSHTAAKPFGSDGTQTAA